MLAVFATPAGRDKKKLGKSSLFPISTLPGQLTRTGKDPEPAGWLQQQPKRIDPNPIMWIERADHPQGFIRPVSLPLPGTRDAQSTTDNI